MSIQEHMPIALEPPQEHEPPLMVAYDIVKAYPGKIALQGVSLSIYPNELTAVVGESGSGKTSLLEGISGIDTVTEGSVVWGDLDITTLDDTSLAAWRARNLGFVFQAPLLIGPKKASENITLPHDAVGNPWNPWHMQAVCERLGILGRLGVKAKKLSGGEQQRVAIARGLVHQPKTLFADEPTSALDSVNKKQVHEMLRRSVEEGGATVFMVSHDSISPQYADRVIIMADGIIKDDQRGLRGRRAA